MKYTKEDICNMIFLAQSMEKGWERPVAQELYNEFYKMNDREVALKHQLQDKNTEITALKNELHIKKLRITQLTSDNMMHEYLESEREHYGDIAAPPVKDIKPELWKAWFFAKGLEEDDYKTVYEEMTRFAEWYKQTYDDRND